MDLAPRDYTIGYCTNVHAGVDLPAIRANLDRYSAAIRLALGQDALGVGLWIPAEAAGQLSRPGESQKFSEFLVDRRLQPFTVNGFPYDNFHQDVVKHRVYSPTWWHPQRLNYTVQLAEILAQLLPAEVAVGSISTLPIGWPSEIRQGAELSQAGQNLRQLAVDLARIESETGKRIVVAIEPEPGCILDTTDDVIAFFDQHLPQPAQRRYLTVCHDICHSAVMMEPQAEVLTRLADHGIGIGKVQVSSAIVADWSAMANPRRREAIEQLSAFAEDRYLHQTGRRDESGEFHLAEDLPELIHGIDPAGDPVHGDQTWVVHFHVPIFLERFGHLATSQTEVLQCLRTLSLDRESKNPRIDFTGHLEIETYAWSVLPESMRQHGLAEDVANEFRWLKRMVAGSE